MNALTFDYLDLPTNSKIEETLRTYGEQIVAGTHNLISYVVIESSREGVVNGYSFYILAPEVNMQHQLITIDISSEKLIEILLWYMLLPEPKHECYTFEPSPSNLSAFQDLIFEILNHSITKRAITHFVNAVKMKREMRGTSNRIELF